MSEDLTLLDIETGLIDLYQQQDLAETETERQQIRTAIEAYLKAEVTKVKRIRAYVLHEEAKAKAKREEAARQIAGAEACERHIEHVKAFCMRTLQEIGKDRVETNDGRIRIQGNGGKRSMEIYDENLLPPQYTIVQIVPDNEAIRKELEAGKHVPGAKLLERGRHCRIE